MVIVACCVKNNPPSDTPYQYYLYNNEQKESVIVYLGVKKVCEFFLADWNEPNPEIGVFIEGLIRESGVNDYNPALRSGSFKKQIIGEEVDVENNLEQENHEEERGNNEEIKEELLEKFTRLLEEEELT